MKRGKGKTFNLENLELQIQNENSCVHLYTAQDHMAFHPYHLCDLSESVKELLNKKIGKYCVRFDGVLCGYKDVKFVSETGTICEDSCFIHVDIQADFFIFKPTVEKLLQGVVNKISDDHVGCLVHNIFNVSLPKPKQVEDWIGDSLNIGDEIELEVTYTNFEGKLPYIRGEIKSLLSPKKSKLKAEVNSISEDNPSPKKKLKKRKAPIEEDENPVSTAEDVKESKKRKNLKKPSIKSEEWEEF